MDDLYVKPALSRAQLADWRISLQQACYDIGVSVWTFNALFSSCGPLHPLYLGPINPKNPRWWEQEVK